jgi:hypothetical protein
MLVLAIQHTPSIIACPGPGPRRPPNHVRCTRHCPKRQAGVARRRQEGSRADLLPLEYCHVVFISSAAISAIVWYNKAAIYGVLFDAAAETLRIVTSGP